MVRILAFQTLFQLEGNADLDIAIAVKHALDTHEGYEMDLEDETTTRESLLVEYPELEYTFILVDGVRDVSGVLDEKIAQYSKGWTIDRINRMDLILLRIALYEMTVLSEEIIPSVIALNESLEIAKLYSDEKSTKFMNGILSNVVKDAEK